MGRRIVVTKYESSGSSAQIDTYFDRVLKYIPADVMSAWITVTGLIKSAGNTVPVTQILWIAFVSGIILTALWTWKQTLVPQKPAKTQIFISTIAFIVWVFALGEPFERLSFYHPLYGSLALIVYTLVVGLIVPPEK